MAIQRAYAIEVLRVITFPSITAFCILSAYAFYLIHSLATDIHAMSATIADMHGKVSVKMATVASQLETGQHHLNAMTQTMQTIRNQATDIEGNMQAMANHVQQMDTTTQNIAGSVYNLQYGVGRINHHTSAPLKMLNTFNPLGTSSSKPYVLPPPAMPSPVPAAQTDSH